MNISNINLFRVSIVSSGDVKSVYGKWSDIIEDRAHVHRNTGLHSLV